jgi:hypothetical protein
MTNCNALKALQPEASLSDIILAEMYTKGLAQETR